MLHSFVIMPWRKCCQPIHSWEWSTFSAAVSSCALCLITVVCISESPNCMCCLCFLSNQMSSSGAVPLFHSVVITFAQALFLDFITFVSWHWNTCCWVSLDSWHWGHHGESALPYVYSLPLVDSHWWIILVVVALLWYESFLRLLPRAAQDMCWNELLSRSCLSLM